VALLGLLLSGCGGSPMDKFNAWLPKFTDACKQSAEVKALIAAAGSLDDKVKIKKERLDPVNKMLNERQKELKSILSGMSEEERTKAEAEVQKILDQYGVS
jgi:hypothetical protein